MTGYTKYTTRYMTDNAARGHLHLQVGHSPHVPAFTTENPCILEANTFATILAWFPQCPLYQPGLRSYHFDQQIPPGSYIATVLEARTRNSTRVEYPFSNGSRASIGKACCISFFDLGSLHKLARRSSLQTPGQILSSPQWTAM